MIRFMPRLPLQRSTETAKGKERSKQRYFSRFEIQCCQLFVVSFFFQGLRVRGKRPIHSETHVPRVPLRHSGAHDRQHASRHLQEDHDRAIATPESREAGGHQWANEPRHETD